MKLLIDSQSHRCQGHGVAFFLFIISTISVVMVYFYKIEQEMRLSEQLSFMEVVIGITSAIMVIGVVIWL